jgi:hypothetical protein
MSRALLATVFALALAGCGGGHGGPTRLDFRGLGDLPVFRGAAQNAIPAIDPPHFDQPAAVRGLPRANDLVLGAVVDGDAHAYPSDLLSLHEASRS